MGPWMVAGLVAGGVWLAVTLFEYVRIRVAVRSAPLYAGWRFPHDTLLSLACAALWPLVVLGVID